MPLSKYYKILGLPNNASQEEVRKRYRKLVMIYHPDRNKEPGAQQKFILIKEAYEIVTGKKPAPTSNTPQRRRKSQSAPQKSEEERLKEAQERYEEQIRQEKIENERYYAWLTKGAKWKTLQISAIIGAILAFCMILDQFLPHHIEEDRVEQYLLNCAQGGQNEQLSVVKTEAGYYYWISRITYNLYGRYPSIYAEKTWIFHEPTRVIARGKTQLYDYNCYYTFNSNFILTTIIFLLPLFTLWYKRKSVVFTVLFHFSYYAVNLFMLFFLFTEDRWAHLLTAGFL